MIVYCDIDNTICDTIGNDYEKSVPIPENIAKINRHFDRGDIVIYWTSRGGTSGKDWYLFTLEQLLKWGCKFNSLRCNKPTFDVCYDDKMKIL